jgi:hypothetical protein
MEVNMDKNDKEIFELQYQVFVIMMKLKQVKEQGLDTVINSIDEHTTKADLEKIYKDLQIQLKMKKIEEMFK